MATAWTPTAVEARMIGSLGLPEILFILVLALLVFGPKRLPQVGRTLGRALGEFRRATSDLKRTIDREVTADLTAESTPRRPPMSPAEAVDPVDGDAAIKEPPEAPVARTEIRAED